MPPALGPESARCGRGGAALAGRRAPVASRWRHNAHSRASLTCSLLLAFLFFMLDQLPFSGLAGFQLLHRLQ